LNTLTGVKKLKKDKGKYLNSENI